MEQPKISDFFSLSSPLISSKQHTERLQRPPRTIPKPIRKLKPQSSRASSQPPPPRAASFNPSIPSTPISGNMPSTQASKKRSLEEDNERVFETPHRANKRLAISSEGQRTPTRSIQLSEASSPHTPFDISSGESSDSDCKIQKVKPSPNPKRKLVAPSPRARPAKKAKVEHQPATQQGFASIKASALATPTASSKPKNTVARRRQTASVPPHPALPSLTSSTSDLSRSSSVPPKRVPTKETQQKQSNPYESVAPQSGDESDCFIEKVLPSPKRSQQLIQQKANVERRRVGDSVDTPVFLDAEYADENNDSDCQVVKVQPSPVQSLQIDLTQDSSSDSSDFSEDETIITSAQPVPPTPVEDSSDTQTQPQPSSEGDHDDNLDLLISYCDNYEANINKRTLPSSDGSSASPDCKVPFSTAPEYPYDDSSAREIKQESHSDSILKSIKQESGSRQVSSCEEDSDEEYQGLPNLGEDEIYHDADEDKAEPTTSTPISYNSSPAGIEGFTSSPPVSYQLPLEMVSPKVTTPLLGDNDSTMSGSMKTHPARSVYNPEKRLSSLAYELQPVYSGEKLLLSHTPGTPSPFRPHHRDALIGLKGILKRSAGQRGHDSDNETVYSPFPDISPLSGDEYLVSSPSERNEPETKNTSYERPSPLAGTRNKTLTLSDLRSKNWVSPPPKSINRPATPFPKGSKWLQQKKEMTPLAVITDDTAATDAASDQGTPSKIRSKRPVRTTRKPIKTEEQSTTDLEESEDELQKRLEEQHLKPVVNSNWTKPPNKEMKPQVIRDGVSEHAIKPTVALFKKKIATGEAFIHKNDSSNQKYCWDVDWSVPASLTEREAHAVAAELERRGIKTDTQYSNFWYNLTMKCSKLVGSPVPLFTAKKKALDIFVKEAMRNHEFRKGANHRKAMKAQKKKLKREKKNRLLQGVEAFLIPGDTDNESESEDSDSDGEDLIAKMHADAVKHQKLSTGGTSCGRRRN
ncbi:hypothetical protein KAF25_010862 [Fusarium avenaceum]|uniref:Uncharacterized protein n=1 Tax=Fusarium avenaceum TaxID=40199 RepID=A0A9P7KTR0_9HYPO|nr:hypothetical protein KAF25_010862 [Fusarium avenaceum]